MKDLSLHLMDIAQNSVVAGATRISIEIRAEDGLLRLAVDDDGKGMDAEFLAHVTDPFTTTRTTRRVGLGIPLIRMAAELTGGAFGIQSEKGVGTRLEASFTIGHIDRIPIGDIAGTMAALLMGSPAIGWTLTLSSANGDYRFDAAEVREVLDGVPLDNLEVGAWVEEQMREAMTTVFGGILDEVDKGS